MAEPELAVRAAVPADADAIGRLGAMLVREHHDFDPLRFIAASSRTEENYAWWIAKQLKEPNIIVLVAVRDARLVGYTYSGVEGIDYMSLRGPAGILYDIVVDPEFRGKGIGLTLVSATIAALASRGARQVVLSTAEMNEPAQRLFARAGFRRTMIEMTLDLSGTPS